MFTVQDSFSFSREVIDLNFSCLLADLGIESLFTNTISEETIDNIMNDLFRTANRVYSFKKDELK